jgi:Putative transposase
MLTIIAFYPRQSDGLKKLRVERRLTFHGALTTLQNAKAFAAWLRPLFRSKWVVYSKRPFGGAPRTLRYLGQYLHLPADGDAIHGLPCRVRWQKLPILTSIASRLLAGRRRFAVTPFISRFRDLVAVGTTIAGRPPHRSVRARLRIRLLPRMNGVEALIGIRMQNTGCRNPPIQQWVEAIPPHLRALTATD